MALIYYPYSQSHRRLSELVPSRHRERGPYGNVTLATTSTLESTWSRNENMAWIWDTHFCDMI